MSCKAGFIVTIKEFTGKGKFTTCMDFLLNQTVEDYEIIVVAGECTGYEDKINKYEEEYPGKVRVFFTDEERGFGKARNYGLRQSNAEWIAFVDGNDEPERNFLEILLKKAEETGADIVGCNVLTGDGEEIGTTGEFEGDLYEDKKSGLIINPGVLEGKIYKRSLFYDNGIWFTEENTWDYECALRLAVMESDGYEYTKDTTYRVYDRNRKNSDMRVILDCYERIDSMTYFIEECFKRELLDEYPEEIEEAYIERMYVDTLLEYMTGVKWYKRKVSFLKMLRSGIMECFPEYDTNPYFWEKYDDEIKELLEKHCASPIKFMIGFKKPSCMKQSGK